MMENLSLLPLPFLVAGVIFFGLVLGSFTTCVIYRVPRGLSLWRNPNGSYRSFCPVCHAELHTKDLIPVFSWLLQKGRCRYCSAKIPLRYLLIELSVLVIVIALAVIFGPGWRFLVFSLLVPVLAGFISFLTYRRKL